MNKIKFVAMMCFILLLLTACGSSVNGEQKGDTVSRITGYAWGQLQQKGQDDAVYCNLPENINGLDTVLPLCYDPVYDILYYINYGEDFFIYGCRDGKTEKIADMEREMKRYSFADGSSIALSATDGVERTLYRCGNKFLFYIVEPYQGTDEEILKMAGGGEITMTTGMKLVNPDTSEEEYLDHLLVLNNFYAIGSEIYYAENFETYTEFAIYNIEQKTEKRYPLSTLAQGAYIVFDNNVYFNTLQKLDLENGTETVLSTEERCSILEWYTDGAELYGLCDIAQEDDFSVQLRKIEIQGGEVYLVPLKGDRENVEESNQ